MSFNPFEFLSRAVAIDLGTVNTLIAIKGRGIVLREPSAVAVTADEAREVIACGEEALRMAGRTPGGVNIVWPLRDGVIADYTLTAEMLRRFLELAVGRRNGALGKKLAMCLPLCVTDVERRALEEAARAVGARDVMLIDEPLAAAVGAGLPAFEPVGSMVADIGGGTTDIAVISLGGIASSFSLRTGGRHIDAAIADYVARQYNLSLGERTAEEVKLTLAMALPGGMERMQVRGRSLENGLPARVVINSGEISHAISPVIRKLTDAVKRVLSETPPELAADLIDTGVTLTGGGALLPGFDRLLAHETGISVRAAESPLECVALGALRLLGDRDALEGAQLA
ncbi:MAG TPA: rod shape-determining protein [Clostridia bacterium]|jgi:rod shape-determining protein MreB|nr:MAG: Rod shape-determining protein MreB [Firmicutes bacterium ADurb.Bin248]HOG00094.1 rod shape-determining protein [Clostridia bacterium]HOS17874.1 rod shape-determining protein [Clostridia bacterium]